jgi:hypothetical protein
MARREHRRPTRSWALGASLGAGALIIGLVMAIVGYPTPAPPLVNHLQAHIDSLTAPRTTPTPACGTLGLLGEALGLCGSPTNSSLTPGADCNQLQQLLNMCVTPPTTTTTPTPKSSNPTTTPTSAASETIATGSTSTTTTTTDPPPVGSAGCGGTSPPIAPPNGSWTCTFDDEFNGASLDTGKWQPVLTSTSGYESGSLLSPVCYVDSPSTISESGGYLNLSVAAVSPSVQCNQPSGLTGTTSYEGGMIASYQRFSQKYGYFQVRAQMPPTSVPGLQETLWLYPENLTLHGPWPNSGEIDYAEFYSNYPSLDVPDVHYPGSSTTRTRQPTAAAARPGARPVRSTPTPCRGPPARSPPTSMALPARPIPTAPT